jgi:UDP-N-acetyl-D-glucosamine dehydrogenase
MNKKLYNLINEKDALIGIIGLGYVGLPLLIRFSEMGFKSIGFDIDKNKVKKLNAGDSYIKHISNEKIKRAIKLGFKASFDFSYISKIDVIIICVPTPLGPHNEPDLSYIKTTLNLIQPNLKKGQLLILESTTYPGTTEEEIVPVVKELKFKIGDNFFIGYSPEREDPGNKNFTTKNIPKIVSGHTENCLTLTQSLYNKIVDQTVPVKSTKVAEMSKIFENIYRAVNIGLVNELKVIADKMGIDIYEVIKAAATKPFGFTPYYPGPGLGGHCIPIDPFYLSWKAKEVGINSRFIELAGEINTSMPDYVIGKIITALNNKGKSIKNSKILLLGLAYKKNVDDLRESPSLAILDTLLKLGAKVKFTDPHIKNIPKGRKYSFNLISQKLNSKILSNSDLVILLTDHDDFDYDLILKESNLIIDTRGKLREQKKVIRS